MKKAIIYVRGKDAEEQEKICLEYAKQNGFEVIETTIDLDKTIHHEYDAVLVSQLKVISRDVYEKMIYTRKLKDKNIDLILAKSGIKYENVSDLVFEFMEMTLETTKNGKVRKNG